MRGALKTRFSPLARGLLLEKERQNHDTNTDKYGEKNVRDKIGKSKKRNPANQGDSTPLFPAINKVTHTDRTKDHTQEESCGVHNLASISP